jgi:hypothetical protein
MKQIIGVLAVLVLTAAAADAQTCFGSTELGRGGAHRLSAGGTMANGTDGAGAAYGFGRDRFFGSAGLGFNRFDGTDAKQTMVNTLFGTQFMAGDRVRLAICPVGQADWGFGPSVDPVSVHTVSLAGGGRVGFVTGNPAQFNVVPTAGISLVRSAWSTSTDLLGVSVSQTAWDTYGVANVGVGLRFNQSRMAVVPSVSFPMGLNGGDPSFVVTFSSNF